jgi:NAD+ diphosphatase
MMDCLFSYGLKAADASLCGPAFVFFERDLLVKTSGSFPLIPDCAEALAAFPELESGNYIGELSGLPAYAYCMGLRPESLPPGWEFIYLRSLYGVLPDPLMKAAGTAAQILDWDRNYRFCGHCGTPTQRSEADRSKLCPSCGTRFFPHISPAVIVAVLKGNEILLARNSRFKTPVFSLLAGFVEPGETLEEGAKREIREEVSVEIGKTSYFGSQSWPFPDSLMIGFIAEYAGGEIRVDGDEITEAGWFTRDSLPQIPTGGSISRKIIEWFAAR